MRYWLGFIFVFHLNFVFSQEVIKTSVLVQDVVFLCSQSPTDIKNKIPVLHHKNVSWEWSERVSSFTQKQNIRTFIGYESGDFKAILSVSDSVAYGYIVAQQQSWRIETSADGFLVLISEKSASCGVCCEVSDGVAPTRRILSEETASTWVSPIADDGILRTYRLALPVAYNFFSTHFQNDVQRVKAFWATAEVGLNEIYMRDIGVRFQVIADEKLISDAVHKDNFNNVGAKYIIDSATRYLDNLIGSQHYDIGLVISGNTSAHGLAYKSFGYFHKNKASATVASTHIHHIAHELGHLLGASHVHTQASRSSGYSHKTEIDYGQSVMGYGTPQNFFSLVSLHDIRSELLGLPYYSDRERTTKVGQKIIPQNYDNFPQGQPTPSKAPQITTTSVKENYKIPPQTFFAFHIKASHPNPNELLYIAHPVDKAHRGVSKAKFYTHKPSENPQIAFEEYYGSSGRLERPFTTSVGERYTFWVGASTGKDAHLRDNQVVRYATKTSVVEVVDALPFRITTPLQILYHAGEKLTLQWQVDDSIFQNTRVRILLSDDFGQTFKHTLVENTPNDGECTIVFPHIKIGAVKYKDGIGSVRAGVIKIEVIDHIAYAVSHINPQIGGRFAGGFELDASPQITFTDIPSAKVVLPFGSEIPEKHQVKATSRCARGVKAIHFEETIDKDSSQYDTIITRAWSVTDYCHHSSTFVQIIYIEKEEAVENPPSGGNNPPSGGNNPPSGGNNPPSGGNNPPSSGNNPPSSGNNPPSSGNNPTDAIENFRIYNVVSKQYFSENYFRIDFPTGYRDFEIQIFDALGNKVFQKKYNQQHQVMFRGYANVKGVFGKGKRLASGTYFYILTYLDHEQKTYQKTGYLFVK